MMRNSEQVWLHQQLEPTDRRSTGRSVKEKSTMFQSWDWLNSMPAEERERYIAACQEMDLKQQNNNIYGKEK